MKRFNGARPMEEIIENFKAHQFDVDMRSWDKGDDWLVFRFGNIAGTIIHNCLVSPWNGRFICNPDGRLDPEGMYNELDEDMDGIPWYDELLTMIYVPNEGESK